MGFGDVALGRREDHLDGAVGEFGRFEVVEAFERQLLNIGTRKGDFLGLESDDGRDVLDDGRGQGVLGVKVTLAENGNQ